MSGYKGLQRYPSDLWEGDGGIKGHRSVHKFGDSVDLVSTYSPIVRGGLYQMRKPADAEYLRIKAGGDAADAAAGLGAQSFTFEYIDAFGQKRVNDVATAGALASAQTQHKAIRFFRGYVSGSGTYADMTAQSHVGQINIEGVSTGNDWGRVVLDNRSQGQTQIGMFPVALGERALLRSVMFTVTSGKPTDFTMFRRDNFLIEAAPYKPMKTKTEFFGITDKHHHAFKVPKRFEALSEFGFLARSADPLAYASVTMEITVIKD